MTDLISRQAAIDEWKNDFRGYVNALDLPRDDYNGIMEYIDELPSVEVEPVKKGKWIHDNRKHIRCSECGNELPIQAVILRGETVYEYAGGNNYCPNCGARMEGEHED